MKLDIKKLAVYFSGLTKTQKKIIITAVVIFLVLQLIYLFICRPQSRRFAKVKAELNQVEAKTAEILKIASGKDLSAAVKDLKINFLQASNKLPAQEETVIHSLLDSAKKLKIDVKNVTPLGRIAVTGSISGYIVEGLPIKLHLSCEYRQLGEFLALLRNNFPVLVELKNISIKGRGEGKVGLNAYLEIQAYLSKEKQ
ncbi:MAG: type 4a pilus biogenesis protein PilO [Candidatus Omnitrophica bacterium]|nr:type 4a pilus biogenesis protein PilO [Candidatus Omnitrophota bacterium]